MSRIAEVLIALVKNHFEPVSRTNTEFTDTTNGAAIGKIGMVHFGISELFTGSALSMK